MKKIFVVILILALVAISVLFGRTFFEKKVPPHELYAKAEAARQNDQLLEAAQAYDQLIKDYPDTEVAADALYYSGLSKYALALRVPGKKEFKEKKESLSELKKTQYASWLDYLDKQKNSFTYLEPIDKYFYKGSEFANLIQRFPSNNLVDDAAFQLTRLDIQTKRATNNLTLDTAIGMYADFCKTYPQSPYREKGIEHLLQMVKEQTGTLLNDAEIAAAYQALSQAAQNVPLLGDLGYELALKCIAAADLKNAAALLGVPSVIGIGIVNTAQTRLNIRSGQGTEFRLIGKVDKGSQILLLSKSGQWYQVRLKDGTIGYALSDFIQEQR
ncbi:probable cell wall hydrolase [Candidatus Moduliflexus flocculans]|uniref:Probable cell wall hydrolase n=1 Tax=Candidatus Moduliflexus flocculans TaxID=1499966 RepID=A0A0S6VPC4_9BACT|nr:probable cell wall hydrolase [Candidatus Moduliflexus flocculans]